MGLGGHRVLRGEHFGVLTPVACEALCAGGLTSYKPAQSELLQQETVPTFLTRGSERNG
jgi:hypothetical protein